MRRSAARVAVCTAVFSVAGAAGAATFVVSPGGDIQAALDGASPGDTVLLEDGIHPMPSGLGMQNGVALVGESRDGTVLDGGLTINDAAANNYINFGLSIDDARTRVSNLTVTGTHGVDGGAFRVRGSDAGEISGNRIRGNFASSRGSAIYAFGTVEPEFLIAFNLIHDNADSDPDGTHAVDVHGVAEPTIQNNTIAFNDDNGLFVASSWPVVVNNILYRNGTDVAPPVVLDPMTLEPTSGVTENVGRGSCYVTGPPAPGPRITYNLFVGNERSALLINGANAGDYESPLTVEPLETWISDNHYYPRGISDAVVFANAALRDFRIVEGSRAFDGGDPAIASSQGVFHVGAEQASVSSAPGLALPALALLAASLAAAGARAARPRRG